MGSASLKIAIKVLMFSYSTVTVHLLEYKNITKGYARGIT